MRVHIFELTETSKSVEQTDTAPTFYFNGLAETGRFSQYLPQYGGSAAKTSRTDTFTEIFEKRFSKILNKSTDQHRYPILECSPEITPYRCQEGWYFMNI